MAQHLFVYGTLRQKADGQVHQLLRRQATFVGAAVYRGKLYKIGLYPGVVPSDNPLDKVYGELYRLAEPTVVLERVDQYEGCTPDVPQPTEYIRVLQDVCLGNSSRVSTWLYLYNRPTVGLELIRSGDFSRLERLR